jgi:hypothetical protein
MYSTNVSRELIALFLSVANGSLYLIPAAFQAIVAVYGVGDSDISKRYRRRKGGLCLIEAERYSGIYRSIYIEMVVIRAQYPCFGPCLVQRGMVTTIKTTINRC